MKSKSNLILLLLVVAASVTALGSTKRRNRGKIGSPFHIGNRAFRSDSKETLIEAEDDYMAVLDGKSPIHATEDTEKGAASDGGTLFYKGDGYTLEVLQSLAKVGGVQGYFYGPIIKFTGASTVQGNSDKISSVQFFSNEALKKLQKSHMAKRVR